MTVYESLVAIDPLILTNKDDNYILQHQDVHDLQKYLWSGVLLPITPEDYQGRLNISDRTASKLSDVIKPLVDVYKIVSVPYVKPGRRLLTALMPKPSAKRFTRTRSEASYRSSLTMPSPMRRTPWMALTVTLALLVQSSRSC